MATLNDVSRAMENARAAGDTARYNRLLLVYEREKSKLQASKFNIVEGDKPGFFENVATGFGAGYVGTLESAALGAATLQEEEAELKSRQKIKAIADRFTPEGGDKDSISYKLASGIGSIGAFATAAPLGKAALPIAGVLGVASGAGEASERARAYGATEEERNIAVRKGAAIGATEVLPLGLVAKSLKIPGLPKAIDKLSSKVSPATVTGIKSRLQRAAATGVKEGAQEAAAAVLQNLTEQGYNPEQVLFEAGVLEEGSIGGGAGAILQGLVDLFGGKKRFRPVEDTETGDKAAEEPATETPVETKEEDKTETPVQTKEETKKEPKQAAKETPVPAETPKVEEKQPQKKGTVVERREILTRVLNETGAEDATTITKEFSDKLSEAGIEAGELRQGETNTINRYVKGVTPATQEGAKDDGKQAVGTPDTKTTGDSVPSSTGVVGEQRAKGAEVSGRTVERGLDDSVDNTGRPARRKRRKQRTLAQRLGVQPGIKLNLADVQKQFAAQQQDTKPKSKADLAATKAKKPSEQLVESQDDATKGITAPVLNKRTEKLRYKNSPKFLAPHTKFNQDLVTLDEVAIKEPTEEVAKVTKDRNERQRLNDENTVIAYLNKFDTPMDAVVNATFNVSRPKGEAVENYAAREGEVAVSEDYKKVDELIEGTGPVSSQKVINYVKGIVSKETANQIDAKIAELKRETVSAKKAKQKLDAEQRKQRKLQEQAAELARKQEQEKKRAKKAKAEKAKQKDKEVTSLTKEQTKDTKLSKADRAKASADANFDKIINDPKTDLSKPNDFQRAREYAEASTNPAEMIDQLNVLRARAVTNTRKVKQATKNVETRKKELGQVKDKKLTKKQKAITKLIDKLKGEGVTRDGIILMYKDEGPKFALREATVEDARAYSELAARQRELGYKFYQNDGTVSNQLSVEVSGKVMSALKENNMEAALLAARAQVKDPKLRSIVTSVIKNIGTTKIMFLNNDMINEFVGPPPEGKFNEGVFEPISNVIYINEDIPLSVHTLLHESVHAATYVYMKTNPNDPVVKQLEDMYKQALEMGALDKQYAKEDVYEFVAEVFSNPEMRRILSRMRVEKDGTLKEGTVSLYEKFVAIIKNFLNKFRKDPLQSVESGLTKADRAIREVLAPSPNSWDGVIELEPKLMAKGMDEALAPLREEAKVARGFKDWWKNLKMGKKGLRGLAMGIHLHTLGDIGRGTGFGNLVTELYELVENQTGRILKAQDAISKAVAEHKRFAKRVGTDAVSTYNRIIYNEDYGATIYDVNPFAPKGTYKGKRDEDNNDLQDVYDQQQMQLDDLRNNKPEVYRALKKHYTEQKQLYKDQFAAVVRAIKLEGKKIAESGDANAQKQLDMLTKKLLERATIEEYFPLVREGDHSVSYVFEITDANGTVIGEEPGFEMFKNVSERDAYAELLRNKEGIHSVKTYEGDLPKAFYDNSPSGSYVSEILQILAGAGMTSDVQEQIIKQYINALPSTTVYRSLVRRGNVPGYIQDAGVALETKGRSLATQAAKIESAAEIRNKSREIEQRSGELGNEKATVIADVAINKHARFAILGAENKTREAMYKEFNQVAFLYTLGFNISSAVVNLSQIPLFAVPYLSARYGLSNTIDAFTQASSVVSGAKISIIEYYDDNYNLKEDVKKKIKEHAIDKADAKARIEYLESIIPMVKEAHMRGKLYSSKTLIELGVNEKANSRDKFAHWSAFFFNGAERFNTQTTILASYDLIRQNMSQKAKSGKKYFSIREGKELDVPTDIDQRRALAAREAMYQAQEVNGGARLETTAPIAKEGIGRVALMYKSYGLAMNTAMIKSGMAAGDKLYEGNPEQRKIAIKQLVGVHLSSLLFAGLGGVPIWGLISMVWDLFLDDEEEDADTILRKYVTEMGFKGPLSTLTGVDVASRIKLNDLILQENRFMRDPSLEETIGYYIGGPALSTAKRFYRSWNDFAEGEYWRAGEAALPAGFGNAMTAGRYFMDNGVKTRGGQFIYEDIGVGEVATKVFGFAPLEYTFRTAQSAAEQKISNAVLERRKKLTRRYWRAVSQGDWSEATDVTKDIVEFNKRHPNAALSGETIRKSIRASYKNTATMHNGVAVNPLFQEAFEKSRREYSQWD